jgi:hypothetical protein
MLVACSGALGSTLSSLTSLINLIEKQRLSRDWGGQYLLRLVIAIPLAMAMYGVIRGGILTPGPNSISYLNPYGLLFASVMVGMLASPILEKLGAVTQALSGQESKLDTQFDRIGTALGVATLDNYNGFICLCFHDEENEVLEWGRDGISLLRAGRLYELAVWFQSSKPEREPAEEIRITGGIDTRTVEFHLIPDSNSVSVQPRQKAVSFGALDRSPQVEFQFRAPETAGPIELWVEVSQKNRLIHVISAALYVQGLKS